MSTKEAGPWRTFRGLRKAFTRRGGLEGQKQIYVPGDIFDGLSDDIAHALKWRIYWKVGWGEAGELKVNFIARMPDSTPLHPYSSKVMEIYGRVCNHVESEPEFVGAGSGWRCGVLGLSSKKCTIQALLLAPSAKCGCNPWLDARTSREVYECLCEWLKGLD